MKEVSQPPAPLPTNPIQFASPVHQVASTPPLPHQPVVERAPPPPVATRPSPPVNKPSPLIQPKPNGVMTANEVSSLSLSLLISLSFCHSLPSQTVTIQATPSSPLPPDLPPPKGFDVTGKCNTNYLIDIPVI